MAKILYIPSWFPTKNRPSSGIFFRDHIIEARKNNEVTVLFPIPILPYKIADMTDKVDHLDNIEVFSGKYLFIPRMHSFNGESFVKCGLKIIDREGIKVEEFDVIHAMSAIWGGLLANRLSSIFNVPYIITEHASYFGRRILNSAAINKSMIAITNADTFITVSKSLANDIEKSFSLPNYRVIPNPVMDIQKAEGINYTNHVIIMVANLNKNKRVEIAIEGFSKISQIHENYVLKIIGDGPERQNLVDLAIKLGIQDRVIFSGQKQRTEVITEMLDSKIYLITSDVETFSISTLEAAACGLPIIFTKSGGPEEIAPEASSIQIKTGEVLEVSTALDQMISNIDYYSSAAAQAVPQVLEHYSVQRIAKEYNLIYNNCKRYKE